MHERQAKIQETQKALSGQNTVSPSSESCRELYMKGSSLYSQGKFSEALEFYDKALDINPDYAPALFEKGLVLNNMKKGKSKEARECFVKATLIDPQAKELNLNIKDNFGNTPLHLSIISDNMNSIKILTLKGADVNIKNNEGNTPLHIAARFGNVDTAKILLKSGADVNSKNNDGLTPLHVASANGHIKMAEFLIKNGSDINAKNNKGETPLNVAGTGEMRELLKQKEAKK